MMNFNIFSTIKGVITNQIEVVGDNVCAIHTKIVPICLHMVESNVIAVPQTFTGIGKNERFLGEYSGYGEKFLVLELHYRT